MIKNYFWYWVENIIKTKIQNFTLCDKNNKIMYIILFYKIYHEQFSNIWLNSNNYNCLLGNKLYFVYFLFQHLKNMFLLLIKTFKKSNQKCFIIYCIT